MRRPALADLAITAGFATIFVVGIAHHAMWRDELLAWMIAQTSATPAALIAALHYDGHPALWHSLLWLTGTLTADPTAMKLVHGAISLALIALIGLAAPFTRLERVLLLAGYFLAFEYTVISRNYGIGLLLALLYARRRIARPDAILGNATLLALLANTNIFAAIMSAALALEYLADRIIADRAGHPDRPRLAAGAAIYAAGFALLVATVWPAADFSREIARPEDLALSPGHLVKTLLRFVEIGLLPIRAHPLDPNFILFVSESASWGWLWPHLLLATGLLATLGLIFRRDRALLAILGLTLFGTILFGHAVYAIAARHWGIVTIVFITCLWMQRARHPRATWSLPVVALLAAGAAGGAQAMILQWSIPFSRIEDTAAWIERAGLANRPLIGSPDYSAGMVGAILQRDITMPECRCTARRPVFSAARDGFRREDLPARLAELAPADGAILVLGWVLPPDYHAALRQHGITAMPLAAFPRAWMNEQFFVYELRRVEG